MNLGTLEVVDLRTVWQHEALDFTKWLSKEENIQLLCQELEIEIDDIKVEEATGRYNADIVGIETGTKKKVIIENQLESTDHKHLGQIITYASGLDAGIVIWIAKDYRDEHKAAIDWLNRHLSEVKFFLIQIELWKIGSSLPAPKFNVVCQPNDWVRTLESAALAEKGSPSELKLQQQQFWSSFKDFAKQDTATILNLGRTPRPQHWYTMSFGTAKAELSATFNSKQNQIGIELYIKSDGNIYNQLKSHKSEIEAELGSDLQWLDLPESTAFRILKVYNGDPTDESRWPEYYQWLKGNAEKFHKTFKPHF